MLHRPIWLALLAWSSLVSCTSLLALDLGTDSLKASLIKPGVAFDVLLTKEGRRKVPSVMTIKKGDRSFGGEAVNLATRFPQDTFSSIKLLLGHSPAHPQSVLHSSLFQSPISTTSRQTPQLTSQSSSSSYSIEELLAMQISNIKEIADEVAKENVRDLVVTVPGWWGIAERRALVDAIELSGMNCMGLINDGTAAGINYAMTRTFPSTPSYHLLYDLGAGSLRTTLISLKSQLLPDIYSLSSKPELKNVTSLTVHSISSDIHIGGFVLDKIVRDLMLEQVDDRKKIEGDKRAMAKLLKEATKVKQVLSANNEAIARIEGLIEDTDFRTTITREQLESKASTLLSRFTTPISTALATANLTMSEIESVILIGGSSRVPMVQAAVASFVGESKIAKNVNADEAGVLGAALYGAGQVKGFRTKDIRIQDLTMYGIDVAYPVDGKEGEEERVITTQLFPAFTKNGVKKTMTLKKSKDFSMNFNYHDFDEQTKVPKGMFEVQFKGISEKTINMTEEALKNVTVKIGIELDSSNLIKIDTAILKLGEENTNSTGSSGDSINDKIKGLLSKFGSKKDKEGEATKEGEEAKKDGDEELEEDQAERIKKLNATQLEDLFKDIPALTTANLTVRLSPVTVSLDQTPMTSEEKKQARTRMREMKAAELKKLQREEARNVLEAFIYKAKELITSPEFESASLPSERKILQEKVESTNEWLWEEADQASTKDLKAKKSDLDKLVKLVSNRVSEAKCRPRSIEQLKEMISTTLAFVDSAKKNDSKAELPKYTKEELEGLTKLAKEAEEWLNTLKKKQDSLKPYDDAVLKCAEMEKKAGAMDVEIQRLRRKKAPRKPKVVKPKPAVVEEPVAGASNETTAEEKKTEEPTKESEEPKEHKKDEL